MIPDNDFWEGCCAHLLTCALEVEKCKVCQFIKTALERDVAKSPVTSEVSPVSLRKEGI